MLLMQVEVIGNNMTLGSVVPKHIAQRTEEKGKGAKRYLLLLLYFQEQYAGCKLYIRSKKWNRC